MDFRGISLKVYRKMAFSRILTKIIFDVDIYPYDDCTCPYWDLTSLVLKKTLRSNVKNTQNVLEIGTGPFSLLSTYIAKKRDIELTAVDINPVFIDNAKKNTEKNNVTISLAISDLFSNVGGPFDVIFFNPPYVPLPWVLENQKYLYTESLTDLVWNGGQDGCETITRFLKEVPNFVHKDSKVILGVNSLFVDMNKMGELIDGANLVLVSTIHCIGSPSKAYIIRIN